MTVPVSISVNTVLHAPQESTEQTASLNRGHSVNLHRSIQNRLGRSAGQSAKIIEYCKIITSYYTNSAGEMLIVSAYEGRGFDFNYRVGKIKYFG